MFQPEGNGRDQYAGALALVDAAQRFAERFYAEHSSLAALVRVFATVPCGWLPAEEQARIGAVDAVTPVLTLLGTRGIEPGWNARTSSRQHRAIPLLSDAVVADAPMIARLLSETGFSLPQQGVKKNRQFVGTHEDFGIFFVGDAATATDERGRRIIPAFEFVERYGIRTVFGIGAPYVPGDAFLTVIVFSRVTMPREDIARFVPLVREFMRATRSLAALRRIFPE